MPANCDATPANVVKAARKNFGVPSRIIEYAIRKPSAPPSTAVTTLTSIDVLNEVRCGSFVISSRFASVKPPSVLWNAPKRTLPAGRNRNAIA
jgi:hypothetical protein